MKHIAMLALLAAFVAVGCTDIREKYPTWPAWGWWDAPAEPTTEPTAEPVAVEPVEPPAATQPTEPTAPVIRTAADLERIEQHRREVWVTARKLRNLDEMPESDQTVLLGAVRADLPGWYRPLGIPTPNLDDPDWVTLVVWDFMPEADFVQSREFWRQTAEARQLSFPSKPNRRATALWVLEFARSQTVVPPVGTVVPRED